MVYRLLSIVALLWSFPSSGQEIQTIIVHADDASGTKAETIGEIEFRKGKDGNFNANKYRIRNKQKRVKRKLTISRESVEKINGWKKRTGFTLTDLATEFSMELDSLTPPPGYLDFEISTEKMIKIDSFSFCQAYNHPRSLNDAPRYRMTVTLIDAANSRESYEFDTYKMETRKIDLRDYLICFQILNDKLPRDFNYLNFFTKKRFAYRIWYVLKTIECEEYFYLEFKGRNLSRTNIENRLRIGWNFVEYMRQRTNGSND